MTKNSCVIPGSYRFGLYFVIAGILFGCNSDEHTLEDVRTGLLERINTVRKNGCKCGSEAIAPVKSLVWNTALEDAATTHANDMHLNNYFSHLSLDGTPPILRAQQAGYDGAYVGEVIARKYYTTQDVIEAWKQSESHCRALMDSLYNEMGGARKEDYWVVDLGRSK
jgi:uncharacterized protein YkwD